MRILSMLGFLSLLLACSDPKTRPETADKLKPILTLVNPPAGAATPEQPLDGSSWQVPLAGAAVTLQFHFIGPTDMGSLTLTPEDPNPQPLTLPFNQWTVGTSVPHDYSGLRHVTIEAQANLPSVAQLEALSPDFQARGFVRLRYQMRVSDGSRELSLAGDFVVYRDAGIAGAQDTLFGSIIDFPPANENVSDKKVQVASTLSNEQNEPVKIGWYVSDGKIKNRRASRTEWELPGSGSYTLVFTVRGKNSRNGDIQIREVQLP